MPPIQRGATGDTRDCRLVCVSLEDNDVRKESVLPSYTSQTLRAPSAPAHRNRTTMTVPTDAPEAVALQQEIANLGATIKAAKAEGSDFQAALQTMLAKKQEYTTLTGVSLDPPKKEKKVVQEVVVVVASSDKNKAKREAKAALKAEKEAKKAAQRAERAAREQKKAEASATAQADLYGDEPLLRSQTLNRETRLLTSIAKLQASSSSDDRVVVWIRGHWQTARAVGKKGCFGVVRHSVDSIQVVAFDQDEGLVKYMSNLAAESIVTVGGIVVPAKVVGASRTDIELQVQQFYATAKAQQALPFQLEDAMRPEAVPESDVGAYHDEDEQGLQESKDGLVRVGREMRLNYRWLDLRTPANQAIFRIEAMIGTLFREYLTFNGFLEVHPPKLIAGASEGGADVFTLDYFGQPACLAMSPQLHKQMLAACSGFGKVFCTGPVFRAENSNTRRHLCEFVGFDLEMCIEEHYDEVCHTLSELFIYIFDGLKARCGPELERVREQYPFEDLQYLRPTLKLTYAEGCALLREAGVDQGDYDDLSTENEKKLGDLVKVKYGTDFFFMDKYPLSVRPFYTMPCPDNPRLSNSYDFFIRGQEILSGAQRIHDPDLLVERAQAWNIDLDDIESYVNAFRHGAQPHGGGGIGLERVVMLFLGLPNIRLTSAFPRTPKRLAP